MVVYFIRHGETDFNKRCLIQGMSDIPLNDKYQAELLRKCIRMQEFRRWTLAWMKESLTR